MLTGYSFGYTVTGLDNGKTYFFVLRAVNYTNGVVSDERSAALPPAKPAGFTATPGDRQVTLAWTDPGNDTITGWQYAQKTTGDYGAWKTVPNSGADTAAYAVTGLENDTAYTFPYAPPHSAVKPHGNVGGIDRLNSNSQ